MASNDEVISTLNGLIETCRDGQNGFQTAAEGVKNSELKSLFYSYSQQRAKLVGELQDEVRRLGGDPETAGSLAASLHRGWMDIKSAVTGKDDNAIISECERGEDAAVSNYRDALGKDLPANVRSIVERQFASVKEAHDRIRSLERASGAGA
ncbi:MAG: aldehyde dehydrogenase [Acidobacteria bacterium]|nr:MAG: aldehyde dehydrogenase [Acidobacteriota bacterium]PYS83971.1 MAG: aldehyde dehydrogenase [Acidobacteriota bacterium]